MTLNTWYDKGLDPETFIQAFDHHKVGFEHIYNQFQVPNDSSFFTSIANQNLRAIIIAEVWCGHCMLNIPIFLKVAKQAGIPVKILPRDENLELMDQYLTNGNRTIPIFIFIDESGNEVAQWGPMAPNTRRFVDQHKKDLPAKDAPDYDEKFKAFISVTSKAFETDKSIWNGVYESMKQTLLSIPKK